MFRKKYKAKKHSRCSLIHPPRFQWLAAREQAEPEVVLLYLIRLDGFVFFWDSPPPSAFQGRNNEELMFCLGKKAEEGNPAPGNFRGHPQETGSIKLQWHV